MARGGSGIAKRDLARHPASPDQIGEFLAIDSRTGKTMWRHRNRVPYNTAALTTAGDFVFVGDISGRFSAMDAESGKVLVGSPHAQRRRTASRSRTQWREGNTVS